MALSNSDELASSLRRYITAAGGPSAAVAAPAKGSSAKPEKATPSAAASAASAPPACNDAMEARVQSLLKVGEECISEVEMRSLLQRKPNFCLYDGFEPSGRMHIAQGIFKAINVNRCTAAGGTFKFWVADWFALMNDKMGGDLEMIKDVGKYLIEVWKSSGMKMDNVQFIWCEQYLANLADRYWTQMLDISRVSNLNRIKKCGMIMGRASDGDLSSAQILYPIMQCTDIFALEADICQLGVDQRKVNMLARDYCGDTGGRIKHKPIILSHHMLYGLCQGQAKMSKSNPDSAVFMEDGAEDVKRKIGKAYCPKIAGERDHEVEKGAVECDATKMPPVVKSSKCDGIEVGDLILAVNDEPVGECHSKLQGLLKSKSVALTVKTPNAAPKAAVAEEDTMRLVVDDLENPILDYIKYIVLGAEDSPPIVIDGKEYRTVEAVREAFCAGGYEKRGALSKAQIKEVVIERVNQMLQSARKHFTENKEAMRLLELVESHKKAVKEGKVVPPKAIRCLKTIDHFEGSDVAVVFAPRPPVVPALSVDTVLSCLVALNQASKKADKIALWCEDWIAFVLNGCSNHDIGEALKTICVWYDLLEQCLKLIAPDLMKKVKVLYQSKELLKSPNAYWISAIDVGRTFKLDRVRASLEDGEVLTESSQVLSTIMHVADMLALSAAKGIKSLHVVPVLPFLAPEPGVAPIGSTASANGHRSAASYISEVMLPKAKQTGEKLVVPEIHGTGGSYTDVTLGVMVGEGEPAINGKVKKLYCKGGDVETCPCIDILEKLDAAGHARTGNANGEFLIIKGSEKSGHLEDRCYQDAKTLRAEFAKGEEALHPGDLKGAMGPVVRDLLAPIFKCRDADFTKAHKDLANIAKKAQKKK